MKILSTTLCLAALAVSGANASARAQVVNAQQQMTVEGLRSANGHGSFTAAAYAPDGSLILLLDEHDGVRVIRSDSSGQNLLAQTQIGATGDSGIAMALDPAGNIYVTGTTSSGQLKGTAGTVFPVVADNSTNSFLAKFDSNFNLTFLTFLGAGRTAAASVAANADAVFVTGVTFSTAFPMTSAAIQQAPAAGSSENGFVERFNTAGTQIVYATYLTGANGNTMPAGIVADANDAAYVTGTTTSSGLPTIAALQAQSLGTTSGFLSKLTAAGSGFIFSTFVAGGGITGLALDAKTSSLLLTGSVALGQFPVVTVATPLTSASYQTMLRIPLDGQSVTASVLLVPGTQSYVSAGPAGDAWVTGSLGTPLFPGVAQPDYSAGDSFVLHVTGTNSIDQTLRLGGQPVNGSSHSALISLLAAPAIASSGTSVMLPGTVTASVASSLLSSQRFDLPLVSSPNTLLPNSVHDILPAAASCSGSVCTGSGGLLAGINTATNAPALALATDDQPNITVRNVGSAAATGLVIAASGSSVATNCSSTLAPSSSCSVALTGTGPGSLTASAANGAMATATLPANTSTPDALVLSTDEVDFGIVSPSATRTITVSNLSGAIVTFTSALDGATSSVYALAADGSTCSAGTTTGTYVLAAGSSCQITLQLTSSASSANDGPVHTSWLIGPRDVTVTGFTQAAALSLSATEIDFGAQLFGTGAIRLPRYLYLSNNGSGPLAHATASMPPGSPFSVTDGCPSSLEPHTVCQLTITYLSSTAPSSDAAALELDNGTSVALTGRTLAQATVNGSVANPSLSVSTTAISFATPVVVSGLSSTTQMISLSNTGTGSLTLALAVTGDFTLTSGCPATLSAGGSCMVLVGFSPSQPGPRAGLISIAAGSGFTPALVSLSGTASPILPANNGTLDLGQVLLDEPLVAWYKVQQSIATLRVASSSPLFRVALVAETGSGHGTLPAGAFSQTASGSCANCWLGVQFLSSTAGAQSGVLSLNTVQGGNPYTVGVTAIAVPVQGLLLTPLSQDFDPVAVNSSTGPVLFTVSNLLGNAAGVTVQSVQASGDFTIANNSSGGPPCTGSLFATASCFLQIVFSPTATGVRSGTLTVTTSAGTVTAALSGYGEQDPGLAFNSTSLSFSNVPGSAATSQTVTLSNTGAAAATVGTITAGDPSFAVTSNCGTLAPGALCSIVVAFMPQTAETAASLTVPVTTTVNGQTSTTAYIVALSGSYTSTDAGLEIIANEANYGAAATSSVGQTLQFTLNNLSGKAVNISFQLPRQFVLAAAAPCASLVAGGSCSFAVSFAPQTSGAATGTIFAQGVAADGTTVQALGYVLGYGAGTGKLGITGFPIPYSPVGFVQVSSGQTTSQTLTLTNNGNTALTVRRISSEPPFYATSTCGTTMQPGTSCAVTIRYAPVYEVPSGASSLARNDTGYLTIESDAATSPDVVDLTGSVVPTVSSSPATSAVLSTYQLSNSALTFANTTVGNTSPAQNIAWTNTGTTTIHVSSVTAPVDYQATTTCATQLPGSICTIAVALAPTTASTATVRSGAVEIASDATNALDYISVIGVSSSAPLAIAPTALNFGTVNVGASGMLQVNVTNSTAAPITLQGFSATGDYSVAAGSCPAVGSTLPAGASCNLTVTFAPTIAGSRTGTLSVASDATQNPLTVALSGVGAQAQLTVSPAALAFGGVATGATATLTVILTNTGTSSVTGIATTLGGANAALFGIPVPCSSTSLAPGASCSLSVTFTPVALGSQTATLTIASSGSQTPISVPLTGTGVAAGSFTLTANGGSTATMTVTHGSAATYALLLTPQNGFTGSVALTCAPVVAAQYATCSLLASSLTVTSAAQSSTATINTIVAAQWQPGVLAGFMLLPLALVLRKKAPRLAALLLLVAVSCGAAGLTGCGSGSSTSGSSGPGTSTTPAGTYQYRVTASSTSGTVVSSSVTLNLIVQ